MAKYQIKKARLHISKGNTKIGKGIYSFSTLPGNKKHMIYAFEKVYGAPADYIRLQDNPSVCELQQKFASWDHLFGKPLPFSFCCEERFGWGNILLQLQVESGKVLQAKVYSDAMDHLIAPKLEQGLAGCRFTLDALQAAVLNCLEEDPAKDICSMLTNQNI